MDDDSLHSLLAEGRLSGAQRDRILDRVLDEHASSPRLPRAWMIAAGIALPAAAVLALVVGLRGKSAEPDSGTAWLVPKGEPSGAHLEARCSSRVAGECKHGDRLMFSADGVKRDGFFAAFAECSGERIWYFPTAEGNLPSVRASAGHVVVDQVARIGEEHQVGPCKLHLFLLERRESRDALLAATATAKATGSAVIPLTITP